MRWNANLQLKAAARMPLSSARLQSPAYLAHWCSANKNLDAATLGRCIRFSHSYGLDSRILQFDVLHQNNRE